MILYTTGKGGIFVQQINFDEKIVKEKVNFIKNNAVKLYFLRSYQYDDKHNVEEGLVSILLSDRPLRECPHFPNVLNVVNSADMGAIAVDENENYALKTIFSATRYVNDSVCRDETGRILRDRIRRYVKYLDNHIVNGDCIQIGQPIEYPKIKMKRS